ncbi:Ig domain-containing protein [Geothermobacter hydrogeniphilus]|uniref:Ig domain-containing protein n=1 Tax=Geothermobacter hydrogeniphilus TaxID=1969733 RepID=UPI00111C61C2|nr:Ig domain-containing protein [Geothermobacter hydrogeniphilus]
MKTRKHKKPTIVQLLLMVAFLVVGTAGFSYAAFFPLEIINIKPAGTGSPAIPATNRIFRAYPGIEYNIRAAVIGGLYPFTYSLKNAPPGMTINPATGEISWPNPQSSAGPITLTVTDSENTTVSTTWSIDVTTNGFLFVDSSYSGVETGSINQPYASIQSLINNTTSENITDIVYFRKGNYKLFGSNDEMSLNNSPHNWIGFPEETVNIYGAGHFLRSWNIGPYFDNLNFNDFSRYAIQLYGGHNYQTIRRCSFNNLVSNESININQGFIYTTKGSPSGAFFVIQDNEFKNFAGASAIGSLYSLYKALIESNYIHSPGGKGVTGINSAISPKEYIDRMSIRKNKIIMSTGWVLGHSMNSIMAYTNDIDISFNFFEMTGSSYIGSFFQRSDKPQKNVYYYRNTISGYLGFDRVDGTKCGEIGDAIIKDNIFITGSGYQGEPSYYFKSPLMYHSTLSKNNPSNCITLSNNIHGSYSDNIIDNNGDLTDNYISILGYAGWQTSLEQQPIFIAAPTNLKIVTY